MNDILHAWALAPAAIGTCCLAADRRRVRVPELAASVLMFVAMLDLSQVGSRQPVMGPVYWAAILLLVAMALAALRSRRSAASAGVPARRARSTTGERMTLHTSIGLVAMAALLFAMAGMGEAGGPGAAAHAHGMSSTSLLGVLLAGTVLFAVGSVFAAVRAHGWLDRTQYAAMGASTLIMAAALLS